MIQNLLKNHEFESIDETKKLYGNRQRYPVGTAIDLPINDKVHYILWTLSTFNGNLKAHTSTQDYVLAVQNLIESCNLESKGFSIVIPLVGTGLSRTNKNQNDILEYLIKTFKLNQEKLNCDIHIIIREDLRDEISIKDILEGIL